MDKTVLRRQGGQLLKIYRDREFFARLFVIALPIILQYFISSSLNMVGTIMIGQLGDTPIAAIGLANQIFFLFTLLMFGINSGAAIFTAQFWGKKDILNIRKVLGLSLALGLAGSAVFVCISVLFPQAVIGIYSKDPAVVAVGSQYLRIFGLSFGFTAVTLCYSSVLRSTGDVRTPLIVSIAALSLNTLLSFILIFGKLGLPALGVVGAAYAVLIARILESTALLVITYHQRSPAAASIKQMVNFDRPFVKTVLNSVIPVAFNEILWSLGVTAYNVVYARIGTEAIAAMNIAFTIDNLALVVFIGIANACAILVGNRIGEDEDQKAYEYAGGTLNLGMMGAVLMGIIIYFGAAAIVSFYKVTPQVIENTQAILNVIAAFLWLRVANMILFVGIFRSGGDTRFAFYLDVGSIWLIGVPMAILGAFVFHLPVYQVYLLVMTEELFKWVVGMRRYYSKRWINNLTNIIASN